MKLFTKDARGQLREWSIAACSKSGTIVMCHGLVGGEQTTKVEEVPAGLAGRSLAEQVKSRVQSRINEKLDKGYVYDPEDLKNGVTNTLGLRKPMLAKKLDGRIDWPYIYVQPKFDGHRCLIHRASDGQLVAYSRGGKPITTVDHILQGIDIPIGATLDGELYVHGVPLQTISKWVKKLRPETANVRYHAYDVIQNASYYSRLLWLANYVPDLVVDTYRVDTLEEAHLHFRRFRTAGYEGAILRHPDMEYEDGKRSSSLLKLKETEDAEFLVVDIIESKDHWAVLECKMHNGKTFRVSAPGTMAERCDAWNNRRQFIGRLVTVEWYSRTKDGLPFHPVALRWKEEL